MNSRIRQLIVGAGLVSGLAVAGLATGTGVNAAPPRSVVRVVAVGSAPDAIAVDPRANRALVVNSGENTVSVLDATTGLVLRTVPLGKTLTGLDNSAYAAATDELTGRAFVVTQGHPPVPSTVSPGPNPRPSTHILRGSEIRALRRLHKQQVPPSPYVFTTERLTPMTAAGFRKQLARIGMAAEFPFPVHPHMLRHACGFKLANDGHDTRALQDYLGHRQIQHTVRYTELAAGRFNGFWAD